METRCWRTTGRAVSSGYNPFPLGIPYPQTTTRKKITQDPCSTFTELIVECRQTVWGRGKRVSFQELTSMNTSQHIQLGLLSARHAVLMVLMTNGWYIFKFANKEAQWVFVLLTV